MLPWRKRAQDGRFAQKICFLDVKCDINMHGVSQACNAGRSHHPLAISHAVQCISSTELRCKPSSPLPLSMRHCGTSWHMKSVCCCRRQAHEQRSRCVSGGVKEQLACKCANAYGTRGSIVMRGDAKFMKRTPTHRDPTCIQFCPNPGRCRALEELDSSQGRTQYVGK